MDDALALIVSRRCPLDCRYCAASRRDADLPADVAVAAVDRYVALGGRRLRLTGGEPAMAWPTVAAVLAACERHRAAGHALTAELCTNGVRLDDGHVEQLDRPWLDVAVSVDGGPGAQAASGRDTPTRIGRLLALPRATVTQTVAPDRAAALLDELLFLWRRGVRRINVLPVFYRGWTARQLADLDEGLQAAAEFLAPRVGRGRAGVRNRERRGTLPLFADDLTLDTDGQLYRTNLVLADEWTAPLLPALRTSLGAPAAVPPDLRARVDALLAPAVRRSNRRVDAALTRFVAALRDPTPRAARRLRAGPPRRPPARPRPTRLEFHLAYRCPNRCAFCSEDHRLRRWADHPVTAREIDRTLRSHAAAGGRHVNLTGGEPTAHPAFLYALELAKRLGLRTYVGTNGASLADPAFARRALPWLDELSLSLHGSGPELHDRLTGRDGSFTQLVTARRHAAERSPRTSLFANAVAVTANADDLPALVARCGSLAIPRVLISAVAPEGAALDRYDTLAIPLGQWPRRAEAIVEAAAAAGVRVRFFGLPMCALGTARARSNDLFFDPRVTVERARGPHGSVRLATIATRHPRRGRTHTSRCRGCRYRALCGGPFREYVRRFGDGEIEAIDG